MLIKEYRIPMPLTLDEYLRGQLWTTADVSMKEAANNTVQFIDQAPFSNMELRPGELMSGTYSKKLYNIKSLLPWMVKKMLPEKAHVIVEESWNAYPYCKTIFTSQIYPFDEFHIIIESTHLADNGSTPNALNLTEEKLAKRDVMMLDITQNDYLESKDLTLGFDPKKFRSEKLERGPLQAQYWMANAQPMMCCYKLVTINIKWFGMQTQIEASMQKMYPRIFVRFNRQLYCCIEKWSPMSHNDVRTYEKRVYQRLKHSQLGKKKEDTASTAESMSMHEH